MTPIVVAALSVCVAGLLALAVGKAPLSRLPYELLLSRFGLTRNGAGVIGGRDDPAQIRLPRIVLAGLVGPRWRSPGPRIKGVFRNPLADPYLLGVASGASLGAVLAFVLPIPADLSRGGAVQVLAFVGAIIAVVCGLPARSSRWQRADHHAPARRYCHQRGGERRNRLSDVHPR